MYSAAPKQRSAGKMKEPVLATAADSVDHAVERRVLLVDWIVGLIRFFSEGTWSACGWRRPTGASGSICWSEFTDGGAAGFRGPGGCAIAAEPSTRASNAIVVINFLIVGLGVGTPLTAIMVRGSSIAKLRQASHFVQMPSARGAKGCSTRRCRAYDRPDCTKELPVAHVNCLSLTPNGLDVTTGAASYCSMGQFFPSGRFEHCRGLMMPVDGKCSGSIRRLECDRVDPLQLPWIAAWLASELRPPK
jgi:hypothetical protein